MQPVPPAPRPVSRLIAVRVSRALGDEMELGHVRTFFLGEVAHERCGVGKAAPYAVYAFRLDLRSAAAYREVLRLEGIGIIRKGGGERRTSEELASAASSPGLPLMTVACQAFRSAAAEVRRYPVAPTPTGSKTTGLRFWL